MNKTCKQCGADFVVKNEDLKFYDKVSPIFDGVKFALPAPFFCPSCRMQNRMAYRNQSSLYRRNCDKTGKAMISMYPADAPFPVYHQDEWWGDFWDGKDFGRDFDFSRPFFEQFKELNDEVPHMALLFNNNENCDFCNMVGDCKNCYLLFGSIECEDCCYGNPYNCKNCIDTLLLRASELCLQCTDCSKLYNCAYCQNCDNSSELMFCFDVKNSQNCFGCTGLNRKNYCIFNKQHSKEEYEQFLAKLNLKTDFAEIMQKFNGLKDESARRYYVGTNNENVSGDYVFNSKDCHDVYGVDKCRDVAYSYQLMQCNDSHDITVCEYGELNYELSAAHGQVYHVMFSNYCWLNVRDLLYCSFCTKNTVDCFGCMGLKNSQYCILNKQYSKEEYEKLLPLIIEHMKKTGEWGRFFPVSLSPFAYNETVANEFYPMDKSAVLARDWNWRDEDGVKGDVPGDACICEITGKPFRIIAPEKKMYEHFALPLPKRCPHQRHLDRIALRNPMQLWNRKCDKCSAEVQSTYKSDRLEPVYCEKCYGEEVY